MAINKVIFGQNTLIDLTGDTVTPETLAIGQTAHKSDGTPIVGSMQSGVPKRGIAVVFGDSFFNNYHPDEPEKSSEFGDYLDEQGIYSDVRNFAHGGSGFGETYGNSWDIEYSLYNMLNVSTNPHYTEVRQAVRDADVIYMHLGGNDCMAIATSKNPTPAIAALSGKVWGVFSTIYTLNPSVVIKYVDFESNYSTFISNAIIDEFSAFGASLMVIAKLQIDSAIVLAQNNIKFADISSTTAIRVTGDGMHPTHAASYNLYDGIVYGGYCDRGRFADCLFIVCIDGVFDSSFEEQYVQVLESGIITGETKLIVQYVNDGITSKIEYYSPMLYNHGKIVWQGEIGNKIKLDTNGFSVIPDGGGISDFVVTITTTDMVSFSKDKTFAEIMTAHDAGRRVIYNLFPPNAGNIIYEATWFIPNQEAIAFTSATHPLTYNYAPILAMISITSDELVIYDYSFDIANRPAPYSLDGRNLKDVFGTASALHKAIAAEDYSCIRVGDYWPITLTGNYRDYGEGAAAGEYQWKSFSNAVVNLEVAAINPYWKCGGGNNLGNGKPHVLFISRDCLPTELKMRKSDDLWEDETNKIPWTGSALYRTLNDASYGIVKLVETTDIGAYIYAGPDGKGMDYQAEKRDPITSTSSSPAWTSRGKLFLPTEDEIWGQKVFGTNSYQNRHSLPIFQGTTRHIVKGLGNGGTRSNWWSLTLRSNKTSTFCMAGQKGTPSDSTAGTARGVPLCFLVT